MVRGFGGAVVHWRGGEVVQWSGNRSLNLPNGDGHSTQTPLVPCTAIDPRHLHLGISASGYLGIH